MKTKIIIGLVFTVLILAGCGKSATSNKDADSKIINSPDPNIFEQSVGLADTSRSFTYSDQKYGFELTLPGIWQEMIVTTEEATATFNLKGQPMFYITASTAGQWNEAQEKYRRGEVPYLPKEIGKNAKYTFTAGRPLDMDPNLSERSLEVKSIIDTFKPL